MYQYAKQSEVKKVSEVCEKILRKVQNTVRDYFTFQFCLIGSGGKKLVTQNTQDGAFDLDYNIILQRDKQNLLNRPKEIKQSYLLMRLMRLRQSTVLTMLMTLRQLLQFDL